MSRPANIQRLAFVSITLVSLAAAWGGCATSSTGNTTEGTNSTSSSSSSGEGGAGGAGGDGAGGAGGLIDFDGGTGGDDSGACVSTSAEARRIPLDIIFLIDQSGSMSGAKWNGTKAALSTFFNDPASLGIGAGLVYFPTSEPYDCNPTHYALLDVPIDALPTNAFALTNSMPADATGVGTPTYGALTGALSAATAYQDTHPTHKVVVVLATDGEPLGCEPKTVQDIANQAENARGYNGVRTYVIGVNGSQIMTLNKIAAAGGTGAAYDITQDISQFAAKMAEIRQEALGCDFEIPPPPNGMELVPGEVNFTYMPKGVGTPKILPRADDLADCKDLPGWYYDSNAGPTKILLCPASCTTVQADSTAKVNVLFGCNSVLN
ncbi:vWA domain-containing protein [Polyangium sp. 6x1]|uniref:vWA domain-containing protein n=1 Tax=Polyangium sp. 6x1 TaxID=3042689 RepID=UPI0024823F95|nr:vWA domain-containing protein [Polyangium sp. 6x1]MDI1442625.1 vWA domain-containing protein [Polyangium sp. 6x1]